MRHRMDFIFNAQYVETPSWWHLILQEFLKFLLRLSYSNWVKNRKKEVKKWRKVAKINGVFCHLFLLGSDSIPFTAGDKSFNSDWSLSPHLEKIPKEKKCKNSMNFVNAHLHVIWFFIQSKSNEPKPNHCFIDEKKNHQIIGAMKKFKLI